MSLTLRFKTLLTGTLTAGLLAAGVTMMPPASTSASAQTWVGGYNHGYFVPDRGYYGHRGYYRHRGYHPRRYYRSRDTGAAVAAGIAGLAAGAIVGSTLAQPRHYGPPQRRYYSGQTYPPYGTPTPQNDPANPLPPY